MARVIHAPDRRAAVASFIDDRERNAYGERFHARYRSVETWLKAEGMWGMIGSETIALNDDPRAIALPAAQGVRARCGREGDRVLRAQGRA